MVSKVWDWNLTSVIISCETNFFFFSVENLTLPKMNRITITQRMKMIKTYYKNCDSAAATYRALRGDFGLCNRPITPAIGKILKKLEETGVVTKIKGLCIIVSLVPLKLSRL